MKLHLPLFTFLLFFIHSPASAEDTSGSYIDQSILSILLPAITVISGNRWIQGVLVIVITFVIASMVTWVLFKIITLITKRTSILMDDTFAKLLHPPLYYSFVIVGITAGMALMPIPEGIQQIIRRVIHTLTLLVWLVFFIRVSKLFLTQVAELTDTYTFIQHRTVTLFDNVAKILIFGLGIYTLFVIWNIDMTAWLASAGIAGIAIGFAAKDTLSNLFSGVFIIADAPYKVGDYVVLDNIGRGKVTHIGLRSTRILTRDDIEVTVPNSIIGNSTIINQSGGPHEKMRIRLKVGVAYGSDVDQVTEILKQCATEESHVCAAPQPRVRFRQLGHSSLDFELLFWVDRPELRGRVVDAVNTRVYNRLNLERIEIPYTKQDVYIKGLPTQFISDSVSTEGPVSD